VTKIVGVDISDGMVAEFNAEVRESGISAEKVFALQGDLLGETVPQHLSGPEFFEFDIVVISAALHHFANPELAMERLASRLKKGGVFFIFEMLPHHGGEEETHKLIPEAAHTVHKHGFTADEIRELYTHAGVQEKFDLQIVERPFEFEKNGHKIKRTLFMARGERV
jgi:SAM-dependent methyltransferase